MSKLISRLERLESHKGGANLCRDCIAQGFTEGPDESCDGGCQQRQDVLGTLIAQRVAELAGDAPPPQLTDADRAWIDTIRKAVAEEVRQRREAWARKRS